MISFSFCWEIFCIKQKTLVFSFVRSCFTEAYKKSCLTTAVKLLEKLCRGVKPAFLTQNYPEVPLKCMDMFASVTDFVHRNTPKVCGRCLRKEDVDVCQFYCFQKEYYLILSES